MLRKDKRSLTLSLILGDGCLSVKTVSGRKYGNINIDHTIKQSDYQTWKAKLLSDLYKKKVKLYNSHKGASIQIQMTDNRFKAWRKFCYPNGKKDLSRILPFIRHPEFALAVWLMDDGYVETSGSRKNKKYEGRAYSGRFRLFCCDQPEEVINKLINWFKQQFKIEPKIAYQKGKKKTYPFLKFNSKDSLKIWKLIRKFVLQFKSMRYKFRHIERYYQLKCLQRVP